MSDDFGGSMVDKDKMEISSDYNGIIYIDVDNSDDWKLSLAKEIKMLD